MEQEPKREPGKALRRDLHLAGGEAPPAVSDDGTRQLLLGGGWTIAVGLLAALLTITVFGGIGRQGAHTNSGWLALLVALMCLPFGSLLFLLGVAKWFRNQRLRRSR